MVDIRVNLIVDMEANVAKVMAKLKDIRPRVPVKAKDKLSKDNLNNVKLNKGLKAS